MTTDASAPDAGLLPEPTDSTVSASEAAVETQAQESMREKLVHPQTVLELMGYAYSESGRKLNLARKDVRRIRVDPESSQQEIDSVRSQAASDTLLAVPPSLLAATAELDVATPLRDRILELVVVAVAGHPIFRSRLTRLTDAPAEPSLTARELSDAARDITFDALGFSESSEFKGAARERLRVNAVTTFALIRILRGEWRAEEFIQEMASLVWDAPIQRSATKMAGQLASAKNAEALGQLARQFEEAIEALRAETDEARTLAVAERRRCEAAEALSSRLEADLQGERQRGTGLAMQVAELERRLAAEQSGRFVDRSHHNDDYEALRTRVIRRLSGQVELLSDGLHALRNGSTGVAEEFVDRALNAIEGELNRLRELEKDGR